MAGRAIGKYGGEAGVAADVSPPVRAKFSGADLCPARLRARLRGEFFAQRHGDRGGNERGDIAAEACDLLYQAGGNIAVVLARHEEHRLESRGEAAIHEGHLEFELEVAHGAQSADDGAGFLAPREFDEEAGEPCDSDVSQSRNGLAEEGDPLVGREEAAFFRVAGDGHENLVKDVRGAREHVEVAVGDGVERACVDGAFHGGGRCALAAGWGSRMCIGGKARLQFFRADRKSKAMKRLLVFAVLVSLLDLHAAPAGAPMRLWEGDAPGALGMADADIPTLTPFLPEKDKTSGMAIVICPGGGYAGLSAHEGAGYAEYLSDNGVACFVLKYRLGSKGYRHPVMLGDAQRAIRTVRANAEKWGVDPKRVGIMGSSAGGHLASTAVTHFDAGSADSADAVEKQSSRPDFGILCYPVISMEDGVTHGGSKNNLLGQNPDPKLVELLSNEKHVTKDTPPCFVWSTWEDRLVKVENSLQFIAALQKARVPYDFHVYQKGSHGIGLSTGRNGIAAGDVHPWGKDLLFWFRANRWLK